MTSEPWIDQTITSFLEGLGIQNALPLNGEAVTCDFERSGRLTLRKQEDRMQVMLSRQYRFLSGDQMRQALLLCHWNRQPKWNTTTYLINDEQLFFNVAIPKSEFSTTSLQQSFDYLCHLQDVIGRV